MSFARFYRAETVLPLILLPVLAWRHVHLFLENSGEVQRILDANFGADLGYFHLGMVKVQESLLKVKQDKVVDGRIACSSLKSGG